MMEEEREAWRGDRRGTKNSDLRPPECKHMPGTVGLLLNQGERSPLLNLVGLREDTTLGIIMF